MHCLLSAPQTPIQEGSACQRFVLEYVGLVSIHHLQILIAVLHAQGNCLPGLAHTDRYP